MLQPIVAKAQAILRDAAPHLEGLEQEEGDEDAANERENTADADAVAMLPGFFTALERAATVAAAPAPNGLVVGNGHHGGVAAAASSSSSSPSPPSPSPPSPPQPQKQAEGLAAAAAPSSPPRPPAPKDALAAVVGIL